MVTKKPFTLSLGDFTFVRTEIPEKISGIGGDQHIVVHELVGGDRVVDATGKSYDPLTWSGWLLGPDAVDRAKYLDGLRKAGKALTLQWSSYKYTVVIQKFNCEFERAYKLPYSITCIVVAETGAKVDKVAPIDLDKALKDDMGMVAAAVAKANSPTALTKVNTLKAAFNKVKNFVRATQKEIKDVKNQIQDVQKEITSNLAAVNNTVKNITTLGGILPNNPLAVGVNNISTHATNLNSMVQLSNAQYTLSNMIKKMSPLLVTNTVAPVVKMPTASSPSMKLPVSLKGTSIIIVPDGTSLYDLAARKYKDPNKWILIANANGLTTPYVVGNRRLVIPKEGATN